MSGSDDIRKQTDTLRDHEAGQSAEDSTNSSPTSGSSGDNTSKGSSLGDANSAGDLMNKVTGGKSFGEMLRNMGPVGQVIDDSTSNIHAQDVVPMTGLDDTSVDKVLDSSDLSGNRTLTEMAGSGKDAAFGVMDAVAGRGPDVKPGEPLPGSRTDPNTNPNADKEYK